MTDLFNSDPACGIAVEPNGDDFYTSPEVLALLPPIALDPCWAPASLVKAKKTYDIRQGQDGLRLSWRIDPAEGIVWGNVPFSNTAEWLAKAVVEAYRWHIVVAILCPAYPGDGPWGTIVWPVKPLVGFSKKRLEFIDPSGKRVVKGRGHALILFGLDDACAEVAEHIGNEMFTWARVVE